MFVCLQCVFIVLDLRLTKVGVRRYSFFYVFIHGIVYFIVFMELNNKVLLGMSGGTDSSVAALLLKDAGYEVTGVTFRFYEKDENTGYIDDARRLCRQIGIPHFVYDVRGAFHEQIIGYFIEEYMRGRTPVPCTLCNSRFKWPLLEKLADDLGIYHIATGHYVQKRKVNGCWHIVCGADADKDQSFFLWGLKQHTVERMILPLGGITKAKVDEIAAMRNPQTASGHKNSVSICFCPKDYRAFLRQHVEPHRITKGFFYDEAGVCLGKHEGYPFYTIGQRRGLGLNLNKRFFVKAMIPQENRIILSEDLHALEQQEMFLASWHLMNSSEVFGHNDVIVKIRYRKQANRCIVTGHEDGRLHVRLYEPITSVAPGQAAVFYRGDTLLGGGIIE